MQTKLYKQQLYHIMETKNTIEQTLDNLTPEKITKKKKSILMPLIYILTGAAFFILNSSMKYQTGEVIYPLNLTLGSTFIVVGIVTFFGRKLHYYDAETSKIFKRKEFYFDLKEQSYLVDCVEKKNIDEISKIKKSAIHGLKLVTYATNDGKWCLAQTHKYESNGFTPVSKVVELNNSESKKLFDLLIK